jgi:predicted amidohydrolase YtcJ
MADTVVYRASKIITMDPTLPEATHVAVRDGLVLAVGDADCAGPWGNFRRDDRYRDGVLLPGFVEGHAHMMTGAMWNCTYAGHQDRIDPDGRKWHGMTDIAAVMAGLKGALASLPDDKPLVAWGFDPIFLPTERLNRRHLDDVSADRPIVVMHSNFHLMTVNSPTLAIAGYDRNTNAVGVARFDDGEPNGELQEMAAMFPVMRRLGVDFRALARAESAMWGFAKSAMRVGVTTSTDLLNELPDEDIARLAAATAGDDFQLRIVPALNGMTQAPEVVARRVAQLRKRSSDKLRLGAVKLMADGSIQGYTGRLKWPGYLMGHPNGIWNTPPDLLKEQIVCLHREGVQMHIHVNGDEASEAALDAIEESQFRRMAALGLCVNLFANHIWYFGDQHYERTVGPDRAMRLDACGSALRHGVPLAIHSDSPVTPMGPLHVAWCAANRLTPSGRVLGEDQKISVEAALRAITLGAAFTLKLDSEIGSIETGKKADFSVLQKDPLAVPAVELKDVPVLGTVVGGHHFPV